VGAKAMLEILKYNTTLVVVDLRQNPLIGQDLFIYDTMKENETIITVLWT
jgi:hypothetical protein